MSVFSRQMEAILFIILPIFYNAREYYDHIMHFDQIERDQKYFMDYYFGCLPWQWLLRKPKKGEFEKYIRIFRKK